jgi:hypothetical protein
VSSFLSGGVREALKTRKYLAQCFSHRVTRSLDPQALIEAQRSLALPPAGQGDVLTTLAASVILYVFHERFAVSFRSRAGCGDEVIDIGVAFVVQVGEHLHPDGRYDLTRVADGEEVVPVGDHLG